MQEPSDCSQNFSQQYLACVKATGKQLESMKLL